MGALPHRLDRSVVIEASQETVFRFFTDSVRWAKWWGAGSTIDARIGGDVFIKHPGGIETVGEVLGVDPPQRIVFTYGYASGKPIPPGGSRVTILLEAMDAGTRLHLLHEFEEQSVRDLHVQGWRFQLSLFGNAVADEVYGGAETTADGWFEAWAITDEQERSDKFSAIAVEGVRFRDRFSMLEGLDEVTAHAGAAQRFMPGVRMRRAGEVRHCQGRVLVDWLAMNAEGKHVMSGTNLFELAPGGLISAVTGFANPPAAK